LVDRDDFNLADIIPAGEDKDVTGDRKADAASLRGRRTFGDLHNIV
jgi:hypothetical protein